MIHTCQEITTIIMDDQSQFESFTISHKSECAGEWTMNNMHSNSLRNQVTI